jgi:hypothetical protein
VVGFVGGVWHLLEEHLMLVRRWKLVEPWPLLVFICSFFLLLLGEEGSSAELLTNLYSKQQPAWFSSC